MKILRTARGARLVHGTSVLSETLREPGPTHSVFDVLAAAVALWSPGPKVAILGFAAGGMVAPLRALGCHHPLRAVDLDVSGVDLFREICGPWAGRVEVEQADAVQWLSKQGRFDLIVDDLSVEVPGDVVKPEVSFRQLPPLIASRLKVPSGVAVVNALPSPPWSWREVTEAFGQPFQGRQGVTEGAAVHFEDFENRIFLFGPLPPPRQISDLLRSTLRSIGSRLCERIYVRGITVGREWRASPASAGESARPR